MTSLLAGILLLFVLVVIHEFGHFIVAKALGVKVLTFSVGFGPKLLKKTWRGTEYCLSAIPLGGYVRMLGESPSEELTEEEKAASFGVGQALWKKSAIALAGPVFNLILPIILFWFVFFGNETFVLPVVGATVPSQPAAMAGVLPGDKILKVDGVSVETFWDLTTAISAKPAQEVRLDIERQTNGTLEQKSIVVTTQAFPDPNPVNIGEQVGRIGIMPSVRRAKIAVLDTTSPAGLAGLRTFDEVVSVNSEPVTSYEDFLRKLSLAKLPITLKIERKEKDDAKAQSLDVVLKAASPLPNAFTLDTDVKRFAVDESDVSTPEYASALLSTEKILKALGSDSAGSFGIGFADLVVGSVKDDSAAAKTGIQRGDRVMSVNGTKVDSWFQVQQLFEKNQDGWQMLGLAREGKSRIVALRLLPESKKESSQGGPVAKVLGAFSDDIYKEGASGERYVGPIDALSRGLHSTFELIKLTGKSFWLLVSGSVPVSQMGGPIMIVTAAGDAADSGYKGYIFLMSLVSVNLGILNLLPIPVLDGGHLMMFFIEFVIRRPLSLRARQIANQIGVAFVLGLMFIAIFNDIGRLFN